MYWDSKGFAYRSQRVVSYPASGASRSLDAKTAFSLPGSVPDPLTISEKSAIAVLRCDDCYLYTHMPLLGKSSNRIPLPFEQSLCLDLVFHLSRGAVLPGIRQKKDKSV